MKELYDKNKGIITISAISIIFMIAYLCFKTPNILFIANLIVMILIVVKAKFSYFSMKTILMNYVLFSIFFQYNTGESYGILQSSDIPLHYFQINLLIYIYNAISYIYIYSTKILHNERELMSDNYSLSKLSLYFCCIIAVLTAIIAFPGMPFDKEYLIGNRFQGLLPGHAWNHVAIICLIFILPKLKKDNIAKLTYLFVIFWFISHYERVDIIGVLVLLFIYVLIRKKEIKLKNYIIIGIIGITVIFAMVYIGEARRANRTEKITVTEILRRTLVQNTAADVGYVFNSSIEYEKNNKLLFGKSYLTYIVELVPLKDANMRIAKILKYEYNTPGGEFILAEPFMNFGLIGVVGFAIIEFAIYSAILSKKSKYRFFLYAFLIATVFRTNWYGWMYIEKGVVYLIPIIYWITKFIDKSKFAQAIEEKSKKKVNNDISKESQIKVALYCERWASGGIESFIMNLYRNMNLNKVYIDILTSQDELDIYDKEIESLGGKKIATLDAKYKSPIIRTLKNFSKFKETIQNSNYDIIHLNICHGVAMVYAFIAKRAGVKKVILHSHNADVGLSNKGIKVLGHNICKRLFEKYGDIYWACSDLAAEWLYTKDTIKEGKVKIINNAIDAEKFAFNKEEREKFREELNVEDKFVIGHIGRFSEQKNHEYIIDIYNEIYKINKNSILLLVGDGELKNNIVEKTKKLGLEKNVIFYGLTNEVPKILWGMDAFVLPSLFEGKPVVGIETQAASLKSYFSDTITKTIKISEYVEYLSIKEEPKKWADEIIKNGNDYERKDTRELIKQNNYDIIELAKEVEEIYINLVGGDANE